MTKHAALKSPLHRTALKQRLLLIRQFLAMVMVLAFAAPASALQKFEEYLIMGSEIRSVRLGPQQVEDPATLIIELVSQSSEAREIMLESDGGLDECKLTIEYAIGDSSSYIQITAHLTADTMNGVMVTQCARISVPGT